MGKVARIATPAATALAIIATSTACHAGATHATRPANRPATTLAASSHHARPDLRWYAATGYTGGLSQPAPMIDHLCKAGQMTVTARTRRGASGVIGVLTIAGNACTPGYYRGPRGLLDAAGDPLRLPRVGLGHTLSSPDNFPSAIGAAPQYWGFAWRGSWCGAAATSVVMPRERNPYGGGKRPRLVVPLTGPQPRCATSSDSTFAPGVSGRARDPLQAPSPSWQGLATRLHAPRLRTGHRVSGLSVTLHNTTTHAITLSPCPAYRIEVGRKHGFSFSGPVALPCSRATRRIRSGRSVTIPLDFHAHAPQHQGSTWRFVFILGSNPESVTAKRVH